MNQSCSLYCISNNPEQILITAKSVAREEKIEVEGSANDWKAFRFQSEETTMIVRLLQNVNENSEGIELVKNTKSFINTIETENKINQNELLDVISKTTQVLIIEIDAGLDEIGEDILFAMAKVASGIIYTGNEFLNIEGGLILDVEGNSDEGTLEN